MKNSNQISIIEPVGGYGGMNYTTHGYCLGFISNNWKPYLFTCSDTAQKFPEIETIYSFKDIWRKKSHFAKIFILLNGYINSFIISNRKNILVANLHFFNMGALNIFILFIGKILYKGKIIVTVHDVESFHSKKNHLISKFGNQFSDGFMFFNEFSKDEFKKTYGLIKPFCIVPHGNYLHYFEKLPVRKKSKNRKVKLLFFGQLKKVKGIEILLEAYEVVCSKSSLFELTIVGRPWKINKKDMIEKFNSYDFGEDFNYNLNFVSDSEVTNYYLNSDIVILPYTRIYNSAVMLLSYSYGRTVITSDLPPFLDRVENHVNGFSFKCGDPMSLAETILSTLDFDLEILGDKGYAMVEKRNDWKKESIKVIKFIQSL